MKPLFIFSLPRSGSTLLQRILMAHSKICSTAEPWILLPLVYMYRKEGVLAEYSQATCRQALADLVDNTPGGMTTHHRAIRNFSTSIYKGIAKDTDMYFVDKTPRYYKIIEDIAEIFPDAKYIFLFRNPVHVFASIIETWNERTFTRAWAYKSDLEDGPSYISQGLERLKERAICVRYEELVMQPHLHIQRICDYLDLEYEDHMVSGFEAQEIGGHMGDSTEKGQHDGISSKGMEKWKLVFGDRFRRNLISSYVKKLPSETLEIQGYNKKAILQEIETLPIIRASNPIDIFYLLRAKLVLMTKANLFFEKKNAWTRGVYLS